MKKTLILLFVVLMTATLFVACSSSPEKENYSVKVVLEGLKDEYKESLGIDGSYYMKNTAIEPDEGLYVYVLYSDPMCESETDLCVYFKLHNATQYFVKIEGINEQLDWFSENIDDSTISTTLSVKASDSAFIDANSETYLEGSIKMYAREDVVLTINPSDPD